MITRIGAFLYHLGSIAALLGFVAGGWVVVHRGDNAQLRFLIYCGSGIGAWVLGRIALYLLARR